MFCSKCGAQIDDQAVVCPQCGVPTSNYHQAPAEPVQQPTINIVNTNSNVNTNVAGAGKPKNKWAALLLCIFLGGIGAHKFYEGKIGMGILYLCTGGLFGIGWVVDIIRIALKPNPYYV
ncbi:MAG: NINE protein [Clostridiales bacterium]|nr:NINE protein [Clostridiales bacterium]